MINISKKIAIFGTGGFAREVFYCIKDILKKNDAVTENTIVFVTKDSLQGTTFLGSEILDQDDFNPTDFQAVVAVGDPAIRKKIVSALPASTEFPIIVHPTAQVNETAITGKGVIITANAIVSCDVVIGDFCVADRGVNIGHDCQLANFVHIAPLSVLSGNVTLGESVYIGTQAAVKEGIVISNKAVIGMGGIVVKDIMQEGTYVGNPVTKIK